MEAAALALDALGRVREMVREALKDLTPEEMLAAPKPHIAWLTWHIARVQDANFSGLLDRPQLWIADGWHQRFNMPPDPRDYGSGHRQTREQVDAFIVTDTPLLLAYHDAVYAQTKDYLSTVTNADLNSRPQRTAVFAAADAEYPARQRDQLQHAPRRPDRVSARVGEIQRLVSRGGETSV